MSECAMQDACGENCGELDDAYDEIERLQARVEALEREAFAAGYFYSAADIYRGSKTRDDVDAEFRKWKATEQGESDGT